MSNFICPICKTELTKQEKSFVCYNSHNFDISKSGYINLLMSQQSKLKRHGDDKTMVRARRDFLEKGYYDILRTAIAQTIMKYFKKNYTLLDAGCGECFYTLYINNVLSKNNLSPNILSVDISKAALDSGKNCKDKFLRAVASVFDLPLSDSSCDMVLSIFAPLADKEFLRILKPNGVFIHITPLENHLFSLKSAVYEKPYKNDTPISEISGFSLKDRIEIKDKIHLENNNDINNLFMMTPYYYKTSENNFKKLSSLNSLDTEIEFCISVYYKN